MEQCSPGLLVRKGAIIKIIIAFLPALFLGLIGAGGPDDILAGAILLLWIIPGGILFSLGIVGILKPSETLKEIVFGKESGTIGVIVKFSTLFSLSLVQSFLSEMYIYWINHPGMITWLQSQVMEHTYMTAIVFASSIYIFSGKWKHNTYVLLGIFISQIVMFKILFF